MTTMTMMMMMMMMMMIMNCFCGMVDRRKVFSLISPLRFSDRLRARFEPAQSSCLDEWSCAVAIITTPPYGIETRRLICRANQWTGFYMIRISAMKNLMYMLWFTIFVFILFLVFYLSLTLTLLMYDVKKWSNILYESCGFHTTNFLKY